MTRYKVVPEPASADLLLAARDALPLVPGSVEDCCARIRDRTAVPSRDEAREWLTFLQALGLAAETDRGFHRLRGDPEWDALGPAYLDRVFLAREIHETLVTAGKPLEFAAIFRQVRDEVPQWERDRHADWESEWKARVGTLLEWGDVFGILTEHAVGYAVAE